MALSACSYVPDAANPVEWYKGVAGWFEGDAETHGQTVMPETKAKMAARDRSADAEGAGAGMAEGQQEPAGEEEFPELAEVPDAAPPTSSPQERQQVMEGLAADREHARYTTETAESGVPAAGAAKMPAEAGGGSPAAEMPAPATPSLQEPPPAGGQAEMSAQSGEEQQKSYLSPLDKSAPPAPPGPAAPEPEAEAAPPGPQPKPVPREPVQTARTDETGTGAGEAGGTPPVSEVPRVEGGETLRRVFEAKLNESASTITTAPAGPISEDSQAARGPGGPSESAERAMDLSRRSVETAQGATADEAAGPRALSEFDPSATALSARVGTIHFVHGSANLSAKDKKILRDIAKTYKERGGTVRVVGHASSRTRDMDPVSHKMANFTVSMRRADAVANELMRLGVKAEDLYVGAVSDAQPIYYESMPAGEAGNRRAEIFIDY